MASFPQQGQGQHSMYLTTNTLGVGMPPQQPPPPPAPAAPANNELSEPPVLKNRSPFLYFIIMPVGLIVSEVIQIAGLIIDRWAHYDDGHAGLWGACQDSEGCFKLKSDSALDGARAMSILSVLSGLLAIWAGIKQVLTYRSCDKTCKEKIEIVSGGLCYFLSFLCCLFCILIIPIYFKGYLGDNEDQTTRADVSLVAVGGSVTLFIASYFAHRLNNDLDQLDKWVEEREKAQKEATQNQQLAFVAPMYSPWINHQGQHQVTSIEMQQVTQATMQVPNQDGGNGVNRGGILGDRHVDNNNTLLTY